MSHSNLWYVRRGRGEVKGPFPAGLVSRYILLERIRMSDELSQDRSTWQLVEDVSELIPDVLKADPDDEEAQRRLEAARRWADERRGDDQRRWEQDTPGAPGTTPERRRGDRRRHEPDEQVQYRQVHQRLTEAARPREHYLLQLFAIIAVVAAVIGVAIYYTPSKTTHDPDCAAPPGPGVNWSNCKLQGVQVLKQDMAQARLYSTDASGGNFIGSNMEKAVLSYADLSLSNLGYVDLRGAQLVGTNLRRATLDQSDLRGADLSYADLTGASLNGAQLKDARLDHAIWIDGRTCLPGSFGHCLSMTQPARAPN